MLDLVRPIEKARDVNLVPPGQTTSDVVGSDFVAPVRRFGDPLREEENVHGVAVSATGPTVPGADRRFGS
jgi:hypothetical protein